MQVRGWLLAAALPLVAACAHAKKETAAAPAVPPPAPAAEVAAAPPPAPAIAAPASCMTDDQCGTKELCVASQCTAITAGLAECQASPHFDFDRALLRSADLPALRRAARCLNALPDEHAVIEGNCDERGTAQYNIALGFRRAHATATYLEGLGVAARNVSEVSYGKELPLCTQATEACWAMNRRTDVMKDAQPKDVTALLRADERREAKRAEAAAAAPASKTAHGRHPGHPRAAPAGDTGGTTAK